MYKSGVFFLAAAILAGSPVARAQDRTLVITNYGGGGGDARSGDASLNGPGNSGSANGGSGGDARLNVIAFNEVTIANPACGAGAAGAIPMSVIGLCCVPRRSPVPTSPGEPRCHV